MDKKIIVFQTHTTTNKEKKFMLIFDFIHQELTGSSGHYNNKSAWCESKMKLFQRRSNLLNFYYEDKWLWDFFSPLYNMYSGSILEVAGISSL